MQENNDNLQASSILQRTYQRWSSTHNNTSRCAAQHHTTHHPKPTITQQSEHHHITPPTSKQQHISRSKQETLQSKSNRENVNNREEVITTNLLQQRRPASSNNPAPTTPYSRQHPPVRRQHLRPTALRTEEITNTYFQIQQRVFEQQLFPVHAHESWIHSLPPKTVVEDICYYLNGYSTNQR